MEHEKKKKRVRKEEDEAEIVGSSFENNNNAKKRDVDHGISFMKDKEEVKEEGCWDSNSALGVFDFPWLKDGVVSKYEDLGFEDNFMSSLKHQDTFKAAGIDFSDEYDTPEVSMAHIPESKLVEDVWHPFESNGLGMEAEDVDCIWSSLLDQPL